MSVFKTSGGYTCMRPVILHERLPPADPQLLQPQQPVTPPQLGNVPSAVQRALNQPVAPQSVPAAPANLALKVKLDGKAYTGSEDNTVKIWSRNAEGVWICEATLPEHTQMIYTLPAGPDGKVCTGSLDRTAQVYSKNKDGVWSYEATTSAVTCT